PPRSLRVALPISRHRRRRDRCRLPLPRGGAVPRPQARGRGEEQGMNSRTPAYVPRPRRRTTWPVEAVEHLYAVVRIQLVWLGLTPLGLIVVGIAPAACAAAEALRAARRGELTRALPLMWETYGRELVPAGIRMLPLMAVQTVALLMLWQAAAGLSSNPAMMAVLGTF